MIRNLLPNATLGEPEAAPAFPGGHAAVRRPFVGRRLLLVGHPRKLPSTMAARKKPWNADLKMPGLLDEPETVPKVTPARVVATPSTGLEMSPRHGASSADDTWKRPKCFYSPNAAPPDAPRCHNPRCPVCSSESHE